MGDSGAKDECEEFLARQEPGVRAALQLEYGSPDIAPLVARPGGIEAFYKAQDEYGELLKRCPKHLRAYRKRVAEIDSQSTRAKLSHLGPVKRGRTPSREVQERGREAAKLFAKGLTGGQVARRLCPRKSEPGHECNKLCADRIRQNATPYLSSK